MLWAPAWMLWKVAYMVWPSAASASSSLLFEILRALAGGLPLLKVEWRRFGELVDIISPAVQQKRKVAEVQERVD